MSESPIIPTGQLYDGYLPVMRKFDDAKKSIIEQHHTAEILNDVIETSSVKELALDAVRADQSESFRSLVQAQNEVNYPELQARRDQNDRWRRALEQRKREISQVQTPESLKIAADAKLAAELVPGAAKRIMDVKAQELERLALGRLEPLQKEMGAAEITARKIGEMFDVFGVLPIPQLLSPAERKAIYHEVNQVQINAEEKSDTEFIETYVTEPRILSNRELAERVHRKQPESKFIGASEFIALVLAEDPGRSFTIDELAEITYSKNVPKITAFKRVHTLIYQNEKGLIKIIHPVLSERKLRLERGERVLLDENGKETNKTRIIYRAVPIDSPRSPIFKRKRSA